MTKEQSKILSFRLNGKQADDRVERALNYYRHLTNLKKYVQHRWHEPFTLADAAAAIGISPSRLSRLFLEKTGVAFRLWVRHERVKRATRLLGSTEKSISEIAHAVGFRNSRTFERSFKKTTGVSPSQYRKLYETQLMSETCPQQSNM